MTFHTPLHHSTPAGKKKKSSLSSRCCESTRLIKINSLLYLLVEGMCLDHAWRLDLGLAGGLAHCRSSKHLLALGSSPWAGGCALTRSSGRCTDCWSCRAACLSVPFSLATHTQGLRIQALLINRLITFTVPPENAQV